MILMGENSFWGRLEQVGPDNGVFLGPKIAKSEASAIWAQKSNGFPPIKIIKSKRHIKKQVHK